MLGMLTPDVQAQLKAAQQMLAKTAAEGAARLVYTFEWELHP